MDCLVNKLCIVGSGEASPRHQTIHRLVMETSKIQPVALPVAMKREGDIFTDWCLVGNKGSFAPNRDSIGSSHPQPPCFRPKASVQVLSQASVFSLISRPRKRRRCWPHRSGRPHLNNGGAANWPPGLGLGAPRLEGLKTPGLIHLTVIRHTMMVARVFAIPRVNPASLKRHFSVPMGHLLRLLHACIEVE